jgi:hypothetical protein
MKNFTNLLIYISGYIDGDGCFYIGKTIQRNKNIPVYERSIQIVSVKRPILEEFNNLFGGFIRKKPDKERHRKAYCWTIKNEKASDLSKQIIDILIEKGLQAKLFIEFCKTMQHNKFKPINKLIMDQRNNLIDQIRQEKHMNNHITREEIEKLKETKLTITPSETDYPYLAGLIDSEGCFRIKKWKPKNRPNHVYNITVEIGNTKLPIMPWLIKRFGGSIVFIEAKETKKASATWTLSAAALYEILPKIRPFLRSKKEVCDKLIEFQETILPNGGDRHSELFRALFEKRREVRERIIQEVHQFNHKGS